MFGLLNLHKPSGLTSRRAVDRVQRLVRPDKVGHAGTLDPLASGVLVVGVGPATRLISYVQQQPKRYRATFLLGFTSPTEDIEGDVRPLPDAPQPLRAQVLAAAARLQGTHEQRPPIYSALKVAGRRSYDLARAGQAVELAPRPITVYRIELIEYCYPQMQLDIECSAGTYVRSLGRDLAESLATGAVMSALVRTAIGSFTLERSMPLDRLSAETLPGALEDPLSALAHLPQLCLSADEVARVLQGRAIPDRFSGASAEVAAVDAGGRLVALLAPLADGELRPTRCFVQPAKTYARTTNNFRPQLLSLQGEGRVRVCQKPKLFFLLSFVRRGGRHASTTDGAGTILDQPDARRKQMDSSKSIKEDSLVQSGFAARRVTYIRRVERAALAQGST